MNRRHFTTDAAPAPQLASERTTTISERAAWASKLREIKKAALRSVSGIAFKIFTVLELHSDTDGYSWPLIETIQEYIGVDRRRSISKGLAELKKNGLMDRRQLISRSRGRNAPHLYRIGGKVENLPSKAAIRYVLAPEPRTSSSERARGERGVEKRHVAIESGEVSKNDMGDVAKNDTRRHGVFRHPELDHKNLNYQELDSDAVTHSLASSSSSPNTRTDDDASNLPSTQNRTAQSGNSTAPGEQKTKLSPAQRSWMEARILGRARQPVRSEHNYIRAAESEFLAVWAEEVFDWSREVVEGFLQREFIDRRGTGEAIPIYKRQVLEHVKDAASKNGLVLTEPDLESAIQEGTAIKGLSWSVGSSTDTNKRMIDPDKAAEMQKEIDWLKEEIDATDRERHAPGCRNHDWLVEHRKKLVRRLYYVQRKLREE